MNKNYDRSLASCFTLFTATASAVRAHTWCTVIIGTYKDMTLTHIVPEHDCSNNRPYYQRLTEAVDFIESGMKTKFKNKIVWDWLCNTHDVDILENVNNHLEVITDMDCDAGPFNMADRRYICSKKKWEAKMAADPALQHLVNMMWYGPQHNITKEII